MGGVGFYFCVLGLLLEVLGATPRNLFRDSGYGPCGVPTTTPTHKNKKHCPTSIYLKERNVVGSGRAQIRLSKTSPTIVFLARLGGIHLRNDGLSSACPIVKVFGVLVVLHRHVQKALFPPVSRAEDHHQHPKHLHNWTSPTLRLSFPSCPNSPHPSRGGCL